MSFFSQSVQLRSDSGIPDHLKVSTGNRWLEVLKDIYAYDGKTP